MNRKEMIERTARIICKNKLADCLCKSPSHYACTAYNKARDIVNILVPEGSVLIKQEEYNKLKNYKEIINIMKEIDE